MIPKFDPEVIGAIWFCISLVVTALVLTPAYYSIWTRVAFAILGWVLLLLAGWRFWLS